MTRLRALYALGLLLAVCPSAWTVVPLLEVGIQVTVVPFPGLPTITTVQARGRDVPNGGGDIATVVRVQGNTRFNEVIELLIDGTVVGSVTSEVSGMWAIDVTTPLAIGEHVMLARDPVLDLTSLPWHYTVLTEIGTERSGSSSGCGAGSFFAILLAGVGLLLGPMFRRRRLGHDFRT